MPKAENKETVVQTLTEVVPKKGSVRFNADPSDPSPLFTGLYMDRGNAQKLFGITNLDSVKGVELSIKLLT